MPQVYHSNAKTNQHSRERIQQTDLNNTELSFIHGASVKTIVKWKNRDSTEDRSSIPDTINYSLTLLEQEIIASIRRLTWMPLDDLVDMVATSIEAASRSNVYRTLIAYGINTVPEEKKAKTKTINDPDPRVRGMNLI